MTSIDDLRHRVTEAEARFGLIHEQHVKYSERLIGLMNAIESQMREQQATIARQEAELAELGARVAQSMKADHENEQLRDMLLTLLQGIEKGDGNALVETMRSLDETASALIEGGGGKTESPAPESSAGVEAAPEPEMEAAPEAEPAVADAAPEPAVADAVREPVAEVGDEAAPEPEMEAAPEPEPAVADAAPEPAAEIGDESVLEPEMDAFSDPALTQDTHPDGSLSELDQLDETEIAAAEEESDVSLADIMNRVSALVEETGALAVEEETIDTQLAPDEGEGEDSVDAMSEQDEPPAEAANAASGG